MLTKDFIKGTLIGSIENMTIGADDLATNPYVGFSLVCQSIEIIGACFDEYDWEDRNLSELRFRLAIKKLFPEKYQVYNHRNNKIDLYKNLRCPMVHQMRPGKFIGLSERRAEIISGTKNAHLTIQTEKDGFKKLVLIYEDFFNDFKGACQKVIELIEVEKLQSGKVYGHNIYVPSDND